MTECIYKTYFNIHLCVMLIFIRKKKKKTCDTYRNVHICVWQVNYAWRMFYRIDRTRTRLLAPFPS